MQADRSIAELTQDLAAQAGELLRNEVRLARAETVENIRHLAGGLSTALIGVGFATAACTLALMALAAALELTLPAWAAALSAAAMGAIGAWIAISAGLRAMSADRIALSKTAAQVSRDLQMIKENVGT